MKLNSTKFCFILNFAVLILPYHYTFGCSLLGLGSYMGCYQCSPFFGCNNAVNQLLNQGFYDLPSTNSPLNCAELCAKDGYVYSGVENNRACFCGNFFNLQVSRKVADGQCNTICPGDNTQTCGAWSFIQVYSTSILDCSSTTTTTTTTGSTTTTTTTTGKTTTTPTLTKILTTITTYPSTKISTTTTSTPTTATTRAPTTTISSSATTTPTLTKTSTSTTPNPSTIISTTTTSTPTTATTQVPTAATTNSAATIPTLTKTSTSITTNPITIISSIITSTPTTTTTIAPTTTTVPCCPAQGVWSQWSEPIGCNDTCGACGTATRNRYCMTARNGCPCTGDDTQNVPCNLVPCKYPRKSCCIGKAIGINRTVICNVSTPIETPASSACTTTPYPVCPSSGGTWSEWSTSQTCSAICGSCAQLSYIRICTSGPTCPCMGNSSKTINCNIAPCHYPRNSCCQPYKAMSESGRIICGPQVSG